MNQILAVAAQFLTFIIGLKPDAAVKLANENHRLTLRSYKFLKSHKTTDITAYVNSTFGNDTEPQQAARIITLETMLGRK